MKIVEKTDCNLYRFECPECEAILEAKGTEFEFVRPGRLACTCPSCKSRIEVKERKIEIVPMYRESRNYESKDKGA